MKENQRNGGRQKGGLGALPIEKHSLWSVMVMGLYELAYVADGIKLGDWKRLPQTQIEKYGKWNIAKIIRFLINIY